MKPLFFDHNSTTAIHDQVSTKMLEVMNLPLNSSAQHYYGRHANKLINQAKSTILETINGNENYEILFTSSATEATNTIFFGGKFNEILFSKIEHASVYNCRPSTAKINEINCLNNGQIDIDHLQNHLDNAQNFLVSTMACNNETGVIQPIEQIAKITHQKIGLIHADLVQALGKIPLDIENLNLDFASISSHKIHGPQGIAALIYRKNHDFNPIIWGGKQQKSKRAGSLFIAGIVGFAEACKLAHQNLNKFQEISKLRDYLEKNLRQIAGTNIKFFGDEVARLSNTCFYALKNISNQTQLINFDLNNICVSAGASCSSGSTTSSRILRAMNVSNDFIDGAIRVSLGLENNIEEINYFLKIFNEFYQRTLTKK